MTGKAQHAYRNMSKYSIKDLERLSGIKAHTIRIWEQRYGLIAPQRTDTNIRYYTDDDLKYILNIAVLNNNGYKISRIATMSHDEVSEAVGKVTAKNTSQENLISGLIVSAIDLNHEQFELIFQQSVIRIGFETTFAEIIHPFLERIGNLWLTGSIAPAQEHFISNLIRQKIIVAIDAQPKMPKPNAKKILLYTPENELHELGILLADYVFRKHQFDVYYLGVNVPFDNLKLVDDKHHIDCFVLSITSYPSGNNFVQYINKLDKTFPEKQIFISGYQTGKNIDVIPQRFKVLQNIMEITLLINSI